MKRRFMSKVLITVGGRGIAPAAGSFSDWQIRIGSDPTCEVPVRVAGVAPFHLEVRVTTMGAYVVDRSGGQTLIDGKAVISNSLLPYGHSIRFALGATGAFVEIQSQVVPDIRSASPSVE